jgi:archaellum component FlaG (FlaF/FlaG flagellin family)
MKNRTPFGNPFGIFLVILFVLSGTVMAQKTASVASVAPVPQIKFEKTTHDFGSIPQGTPVTTTFTFKNTGKAPLVLSNVQASCGCTTPSYTKEPIAPGKTGTITATYNAASVGQFNKSITVTSNAGEPVVLMLQGTVVAKEQQGGSAQPK